MAGFEPLLVFLQAENTGLAYFEARAGRSGVMTFKPSSLRPVSEPQPQVFGGVAVFSSKRAGKVGEMSFGGRLGRGLQISTEDYEKAFKTVVGEASMIDLLSVGWEQERLWKVRQYLHLENSTSRQASPKIYTAALQK